MSKTALITGATSGIGEAATRAFAAAGWRVIATGRRAERLKALVDAIGADKVHPAAFDVTDEAARDAALAALPDGFRGIDLLINNAGLALGRNPAQAADLAQWKTMIDTNVTALASLTHKLLPGLIARRGAIINLSSVAANYPYTGGNVYVGNQGVREGSFRSGCAAICTAPACASRRSSPAWSRPSSRWCARAAIRRRRRRSTVARSR